MRNINKDFFIDNEPNGKVGDICIEVKDDTVGIVTEVIKIERTQESMDLAISKMLPLPDFFDYDKIEKGKANIYKYVVQSWCGEVEKDETYLKFGFDNVQNEIQKIKDTLSQKKQLIDNIQSLIEE